MYAELVTFFQDESQVALSGVFLPSEGHLGHLQTLTMTNEAVICIFL